MNKLLFILLASLCVHSVAFSQRYSIKGKVTDEEGLGIPGVTVVVKGTQTGTSTDVDGNYTVNIPESSQILVFSFIGMGTEERAIENQRVINVIMRTESLSIDEIIVVGYGQQKKLSSVASISQVKGDDLKEISGVTNLSEQMQGIMPGVTVINTSSKPGDAFNTDVFIRGKASWRSSSILTLVDGVERDFNDVDPNEIETISVLKDASATAVYGVKGANGVILVTTKRGSLKAPEITFEANFGMKQPTTKPEFADYVTSMNKWNEAVTNDKQWDKLIPQSTIDAWSNALSSGNYGPYNVYFPQIDWWNEIVKNGTSQKYNISLRGGTNFVKYFTSLGYLDDGDIFKTKKNDLYDPSFGYKRYNWRTNFDFNLSKTTELTINLSGHYGYRSQMGYHANPQENLSTGERGFFNSIYLSPRNIFPIKYEDGTFGLNYVGEGNLIANFDLGQRLFKTNQNFIDVILKQELDFLIKGLKSHVKLSYNTESGTLSEISRYATGSNDYDAKNIIGYHRTYDYSNPLPEGGYAMITNKRWPEIFQGDNPSARYDDVMNGGFQKNLYYEIGLDYAKNINGHNITAMAVMNRYEYSGLKNNSSTGIRFPLRNEAWVSRLTYNWRERYLAEINGAYTGSQKFARGKRFGFFPSYALGWRVSEEPFVKDLIGTEILSNLKVRYSSGEIGYDQSAPEYAYIQVYSNIGGGVSFGDYSRYTYSPLYREGVSANENATWEKAKKQNLGFDIGIINKLDVTLDLFKEKREGILMPVATPGWVGIAEPTGNIGETKNHGYEIETTWRDRINRTLDYWIKANYTFSENRVVYRDDPYKMDDYLKNAGKPIDVNRPLIVAGYYDSLDDIFNGPTTNNTATQNKLIPGDFLYMDFNGDGEIQDNYDRVPMKNLSYPLSTYGFSGGLNYKRFGISFNFYGVSQISKQVDGNLYWDLGDGNSGVYTASPDVIYTWTPENADIATKPVLHSDHRGYSMRANTTYLFQDASYLRLKNLELNYHISNKLIKDLGISKLQVYASGNNLITFTNYFKNIDPEQSGAFVYPIIKRYNLGVRLSF
jgi:TonB-linked SusC/RagA family outer membrane protein